VSRQAQSFNGAAAEQPRKFVTDNQSNVYTALTASMEPRLNSRGNVAPVTTAGGTTGASMEPRLNSRGNLQGRGGLGD